MKKFTLVHAALMLALIFVTATSALAFFPNYTFGTFPTEGDDDITIPIQQGWYNNIVAWSFCTDTNNVRYASSQPVIFGLPLFVQPASTPIKLLPIQRQLTFAPRLSSALDHGARPLYVVTNFNNNGPVFSTSPKPIPGDPTYSALWEVRFVTWLPGVTPHFILNARPENPVTNPYGLPDNSKVSISSVPPGSNDPNTRIVVDCPIVALGSLETPAGNPRFGGIYRIPQIIALNSRNKTITLPVWDVFCKDNIHQKVGIVQVIIPDVQDPLLAAQIKANLAPGLGEVPLSDTQNFWVINWQQKFTTPSGQQATLVVPPGQNPIVEECPSNFFWGPGLYPCPFSSMNTNTAYTPIDIYVLLNRNFNPAFPGFTDKSVIETPEFIASLEANGLLTIISGNTRINTPQIPNFEMMKEL